MKADSLNHALVLAEQARRDGIKIKSIMSIDYVRAVYQREGLDSDVFDQWVESLRSSRNRILIEPRPMEEIT